MKTIALIAACLMVAGGMAYAQQPASMGAGGGGGMSDMMGMMMMMHPSIAVDNEAVYVIRGDQVYKLSKADLKILATGTLPKMEMSGMSGMSGMGGMSGMSGMSESAGAGSGPEMAARPEMQQMMQQMRQMQPSQFEQNFLTNMIRHHQGAIIMSQLALTKATHPELKAFAEKTIQNQGREQQEFGTWLKTWHNVSASKQPTQLDARMTEHLRALSGRDFEIRFMQDMIIHHKEAVEMGRDAQQQALHPQVKAAAAKIVDQQSAEINQLRNWLQSWYGISSTR